MQPAQPTKIKFPRLPCGMHKILRRFSQQKIFLDFLAKNGDFYKFSLNMLKRAALD